MALGGHLATVRNSNEQSWIYRTFGQAFGGERLLLIGLSDASAEGTFTWSSGEESDYRLWAAGEIAWPAAFGGYAVEMTENLISPIVWTDLESTVELDGGDWNVSIPRAAARQFFSTSGEIAPRRCQTFGSTCRIHSLRPDSDGSKFAA